MIVWCDMFAVLRFQPRDVSRHLHNKLQEQMVAETVCDVNNPPLFSFTKRSKMALGNGKLVFCGAMWVLQGKRKHSQGGVTVICRKTSKVTIMKQSNILHSSALISARSFNCLQEPSDEALAARNQDSMVATPPFFMICAPETLPQSRTSFTRKPLRNHK